MADNVGSKVTYFLVGLGVGVLRAALAVGFFFLGVAATVAPCVVRGWGDCSTGGWERRSTDDGGRTIRFA